MLSLIYISSFILTVYCNTNKTSYDIAKASKLQSVKFSDFCGETIKEPQFLLQSANYPENYPPNSNCEVILQGEKCPQHYKLRFLDLNIEKSNGCTKDRLEIDNLDAICGEKTGSKTYLVKNGTLKLRFVTDGEENRKGYKILVTRIEECLNDTSFDSKSSYPYSGLEKCCIQENKSPRRFFIKSPKFPVSMSHQSDCIFQIFKASNDICRIRLKFQFFWLGNSLDCKEGFIEIDGKTICGCQSDLSLVSNFHENNMKILRFRSEGLVTNSYSGFFVEIFQDECPRKSKASDKIIGENSSRHSLPYSNTKTDIYYFGSPDDEIQREREETNYLEIEKINGFVGNTVNGYSSCLQWNQLQFNSLSEDIVVEGGCEKDYNVNKINEEKRCLEYNDQNGFIISPGYPFFYPGDVNLCYRFQKRPGYCGIKLFFLDFRIGFEDIQCSKERLDIGSIGSYCGTKLWNKLVILDLRYQNFEDIDFKTTVPRCIQGFKALFEQIPCEEITTPRTNPPMTTILPVPPPIPTEKPFPKCGGVLRQKTFRIMISSEDIECTFVIENNSKDVCRIILNFEEFLLDCSRENLTINGKGYCGDQRDRRVTIYTNPGGSTLVLYKKFDFQPSKDTKVNIRGYQDSENCIDMEPPAQLNK